MTQKKGIIVHEEIISRIKDRFDKLVKPIEGMGYCLYAAHAAATELKESGIDPLIQAGTMMWPRVPPERIPHTKEEYESSNEQTHFSFIFTKSGLRAARLGLLPEMHVWVVIEPEKPTVIDFSTKFLPSISERILGAKWEGPLPPDYIWCQELPKDVYYQADPLATLLAMKLLYDKFKPDYIPEQVSSRFQQLPQ